MENKDLVNKNFVNARKEVEDLLGINLTLIELFELRKDIEFTTNIYLQDIKNFNIQDKEDPKLIRPDFEAALLFMNRNYGTQMYNELCEDYHKFDYWRTKLQIEAGFDYYTEYFKRVQEEMHFP
jgi:hypothetical protein